MALFCVGFGAFVHCNGSVYIGNWVDGKRHGLGKFKFFGLTDKEAIVFEGEWYMDKRSMYGKYTFPSGEVYEGEMDAAGERVGRGKVLYANKVNSRVLLVMYSRSVWVA